jgi:hypothetical protein
LNADMLARDIAQRQQQGTGLPVFEKARSLPMPLAGHPRFLACCLQQGGLSPV